MNITIFQGTDVEYLAHMFATAAERGTKVRMSQDSHGITIAVGAGCWTHPMGKKADASGHYPVQ